MTYDLIYMNLKDIQTLFAEYTEQEKIRREETLKILRELRMSERSLIIWT